ncbi:EcoAI/FtnUII family type I restriction enzme subunit R [Isoptericola sp. NPDC019482]|uniref:EcoAI/FtnUII family type I restriction enzme subunit R n=1 Tax=Isoptericola sp. NPDC019482 TaxID=3154688 RepID=UPI00348859B6
MVQGPDESTTCRDFIVPALRRAGWSDDQIVEQVQLQNPESEHARRHAKGELRVADYVLEVDGVRVAVVEAKRLYRSAADAMGQAIDYAQRLDVPFAFGSNGRTIIRHDRHAGTERDVASFPSPDDVWAAFVANRGLTQRAATTVRVPYNRQLRAHGGRDVKEPRYYQQVAVQRAIEAIDGGRTRALLLMATGTGKTFTALQLIHKLRESSRALDGGRAYRVLYLADQDVLVADPMKDFRTAFGAEAVTRLAKRSTSRSRDLYFATYQALDGEAATAGDTAEGGTPLSVFEDLPRDFFSLVIVDECHRGSASEESRWRKILEHFDVAVQVGLTATPKRDTNVDTYEYFGEPVFEYSLKQGIEDGYLAPYRVRRVVLDVDALGWEAMPGQRDDFGREIPEGVFGTKDFERRLSLPDRTEAMAQHLAGLLRETPDSRAAVFCVSAQHAYDMRRALVNADPDKSRRDPQWVVRIVGEEPDKDRFLEHLTDPTSDWPQVATTMRLLSTGVDMEDLNFVVLCRPVGSMIEFKQIVGRGTRLYPPKGKQYFEVVDYVGASAKFRDPTFDGPLPAPRKERVLPSGEVVVDDEGEDPLGGDDAGEPYLGIAEPEPEFRTEPGGVLGGIDGEPDAAALPERILTVSGESITLLGERMQVINPETGRLETMEYREYVGARVRTLFPTVGDLRAAWMNPTERQAVLARLEFLGLDLDLLAQHVRLAEADPFDVLASVAWDLEPRTRRERADRVRVSYGDRIERLSEAARAVIDVLLDRYAQRGVNEVAPAALQVPPLTEHGTAFELAEEFGGIEGLRTWLADLQRWLYEDSRMA